ncbi:hypothetical protein JRQ81_017869 [Phrynocephalus forsythii]|uniref:C-C motif chemokine n=1 Tax=Phrynocephalus forsythii TaxID=171643 RepID=A0A9Q0XUH0_9SAUR|nr:hypothetical protein JRQ81_017869 [Phrynocephalus forsythii]
MMMTGFYQKTTALIILMGLFLFWSTGEAQSNRDCCLSYTKNPLPKRIIRGFTEQLSSEVCDINAVIFHTKNGFKACANPKDLWVRKHLRWLSILQTAVHLPEYTSPFYEHVLSLGHIAMLSQKMCAGSRGKSPCPPSQILGNLSRSLASSNASPTPHYDATASEEGGERPSKPAIPLLRLRSWQSVGLSGSLGNDAGCKPAAAAAAAFGAKKMKLKRFLLRYYPPGIILEYVQGGEVKTKSIDLLDLNVATDVGALVEDIRNAEPLITASHKNQVVYLILRLQEMLDQPVDHKFCLFKVLRTHILPLTNVVFNKSGSCFITGVMTEHAKCGTQLQEKSCALWKDIGMSSMLLLSIIPMVTR